MHLTVIQKILSMKKKKKKKIMIMQAITKLSKWPNVYLIQLSLRRENSHQIENLRQFPYGAIHQ